MRCVCAMREVFHARGPLFLARGPLLHARGPLDHARGPLDHARIGRAVGAPEGKRHGGIAHSPLGHALYRARLWRLVRACSDTCLLGGPKARCYACVGHRPMHTCVGHGPMHMRARASLFKGQRPAPSSNPTHSAHRIPCHVPSTRCGTHPGSSACDGAPPAHRCRRAADPLPCSRPRRRRSRAAR